MRTLFSAAAAAAGFEKARERGTNIYHSYYENGMRAETNVKSS